MIKKNIYKLLFVNDKKELNVILYLMYLNNNANKTSRFIHHIL